MSRIFKSDTDCADCLCRVCARNSCNDSQNRLCGDKRCNCDCTIGVSTVVETDTDCPDFLPDECLCGETSGIQGHEPIIPKNKFYFKNVGCKNSEADCCTECGECGRVFKSDYCIDASGEIVSPYPVLFSVAADHYTLCGRNITLHRISEPNRKIASEKRSSSTLIDGIGIPELVASLRSASTVSTAWGSLMLSAANVIEKLESQKNSLE